MSSVQEEKPVEGITKPRIPELRNAELVSRLLAATPPYLYSALPFQPHAYFFSEMLRSFVQARHGCRAPLPHHTRRLKKRGPKYFAGDDGKGDWQRRVCESWKMQSPEEKQAEPQEQEPTRPDGPLELTVDKQPRRLSDESPRRMSPKVDRPKSNSPGPPGRFVDVGVDDGLPKPEPYVRNIPGDQSVPPSNLILPPPPPMWYPPLYTPPFGVDPLNFFIDLRVSGHIYDRKRAAGEAGLGSGPEIAPAQETQQIPGTTLPGDRRHLGHRPRHASAFSVPNRSSVPHDSAGKYFDRTSRNAEGTPYIMRNLKRIYETLKDKAAEDTKIDTTKAEASDVDDDVIQT